MKPSPLRSTDRRAAVVLYDGKCAICRSGVEILRRLDWRQVLRYQDARSDEPLPTVSVPLNRARLLEEMHLIPPNGDAVYCGFRAFRWMAWRLPLTLAFAPLLYVPGVPWLGQRIYSWIARNRFQLMPCRDGVCSVHWTDETSRSQA